MTDPDLTDDDVLVTKLGDALDHTDPVPGEARAAALTIFELRHVDEELATLVADSLLDEQLVVRGISEPEPRLVTFSAPAVSIDVELGADGRTMLGAISPPAARPIQLETESATVSTVSDELGRFRGEVGPGRCRVRVQAGDVTVVTPWITR